MAYRFKARSATPGEYNFSAGTLGFAPAVSAVLTSAHIGDGTAGTYQPVAAADVQAGVAVGVSPAVGTFAVPAENVVKAGETYGNSAEFTGTYDPVTGNYTDPGKANVLTGNDYYFGGVLQTAEYSPDFPAAAAVLDSDTVNGSPGTYHAPDAAEVISTAVFGPSSGTAGTYDVSNVSAGNIKKDVSIGGVTGTYDPMAAAVFPAAANVSTVETAYGPTGAEYAGSLNLSLYTLISGVVAAQYVLVGHDNYTGGDAGTFDESARNTDPGEANVIDGVAYKILNVAKEGTYAGGGGYTYGDNDPDFVLTTADGAGNYVPIADSDTVDGGVEYGVGEEGTGVNATTILAALGLEAGNLDDQLSGIKAKTDVIPASPAEVGSAMTLTTGERTSIADAILTRDLKSITTTVTYCIYTFVMAALKSAVSGTSWLIQKPSGAEHKTGTVTTDVNGNITGADLGDES